MSKRSSEDSWGALAQCSDARQERDRLEQAIRHHAVRAVALGATVTDAATAANVSRQSVRDWVEADQ